MTALFNSRVPSLRRQSEAHHPIAAKVPQITALFWVIKLLTTGMGEAAADYLAKVNIGLAALVGLVGFGVAMRWQLRSRAYRAETYWFAVAMVAVFGTMGADALHILFRVPYAASTLTCLVAMFVVFRWWFRSEGTLSIHSIVTRRRELFYWTAVLATFAMGTAIGDLTATTLHLGFAGATALFAALIVIPAAGWRWWNWNPVVCFWAAYILTRPLGASIADWLGKPKSFGHGLGLGDGPVALGSSVLIVIMVAVVARRRDDIQGVRERATPKLLYHHLDRAQLDDALQHGAVLPQSLDETASSLSAVPPVIWLTEEPVAHESRYRIAVAVTHAARWEDWVHIYRVPRALLRRHRDQGAGDAARWVTSHPITVDEWATVTDLSDGTQVWPHPSLRPLEA